MDFEEELMDLESNESAYLPQQAQQVAPLAVTRGDHSPASIASDTAAILHQRRDAELQSAPSSWISMLSGLKNDSTTSGEAGEASDSSAVALDSSIGWYDSIELLLASAEDRYLAWQQQLETQGSVTEEEYRREEAARTQRQRATVDELKQEHSALVRHRLAIAVASTDHTTNGMEIDELLSKLNRVVTQSEVESRRGAHVSPWTRLVEHLPPVERDYVAQSADEMFVEKMKYPREASETEAVITAHLQDLFRLQAPMRGGQRVGKCMTHSLGQALRAFADIFHACYAELVATTTSTPSTVMNPGDALADVLPLVAADVNQFAAILVQVLMYKHMCLRDWRGCVHRAVLDALFAHLQPTLHALYVACFTREDAYVSRLVEPLRTAGLDRFGIKPVFRLDGCWRFHETPSADSPPPLVDSNERQLRSCRQYDALIQLMNTWPSHRSPCVKANTLAAICRGVDACIKAHYAAVREDEELACTLPPLEVMQQQTSVSADDLCALLAFLLVASPAASQRIVTQLAILGSFLAGDSAAMGHEAFAVAALWSAVTHLCHLA